MQIYLAQAKMVENILLMIEKDQRITLEEAKKYQSQCQAYSYEQFNEYKWLLNQLRLYEQWNQSLQKQMSEHYHRILLKQEQLALKQKNEKKIQPSKDLLFDPEFIKDKCATRRARLSEKLSLGRFRQLIEQGAALKITPSEETSELQQEMAETELWVKSYQEAKGDMVALGQLMAKAMELVFVSDEVIEASSLYEKYEIWKNQVENLSRYLAQQDRQQGQQQMNLKNKQTIITAQYVQDLITQCESAEWKAPELETLRQIKQEILAEQDKLRQIMESPYDEPRILQMKSELEKGKYYHQEIQQFLARVSPFSL